MPIVFPLLVLVLGQPPGCHRSLLRWCNPAPVFHRLRDTSHGPDLGYDTTTAAGAMAAGKGSLAERP
ncbi:MAG: hypothetical protein F4Z10_05835 [Synechococcus sp. SB0666_bin_14]|nr:hypothetical protein [Synechococcus sp. SB0666_bin_14]MYA91637.1 hypothetical protein [Synechococcus sp. SB0663_bin_10]